MDKLNFKFNPTKLLIPLFLVSCILSSLSCGGNRIPVCRESIQDLGLLQTVEAEYEVIVKNDSAWIERFKPGKRVLLYSMKVIVTAGVNFFEVQSDDISIDDEKKIVNIKLPQPQIITINKPETGVEKLWEKVDLFRNSFDTKEREKLKTIADDRIEELIDKSDILKTAKENARLVMEAMYKPLGYSVYVKFGNN